MFYTIRIKDKFRYFPFFRSLIDYSRISIRYFMEKKIWDVVKYSRSDTGYVYTISEIIKSSISYRDASNLSSILNKLRNN